MRKSYLIGGVSSVALGALAAFIFPAQAVLSGAGQDAAGQSFGSNEIGVDSTGNEFLGDDALITCNEMTALTDNEIRAMSLDEVQNVISESYDLAIEESDADCLFVLGRLAWLHDDQEFGAELLSTASSAGSLAAATFLSTERSRIQQQQALAAKQALVTAATVQPPSQPAQTIEIDFSRFNQPAMMKALYDGDLAYLRQNELFALNYVDAVNDVVSDSGGVLMIVTDPEIIDIVDPSLSARAARKMMNSPSMMNDATNVGMSQLGAFFGAIVDTRRNGGSVQDEVNEVNRRLANSSYANLDLIRQDGTTDGRRFARMFETNRPAFERMYGNLRRFILE